MKDILAKLAALEGTAQPAGKTPLTESVEHNNPDLDVAYKRYVNKQKQGRARGWESKEGFKKNLWKPAPVKKVDEVSAAAMGRAAEREYANQDFPRSPVQAPSAQRKCYIVQKGSNKKIGQGYSNFGDAQRARSKMPNPDQYSLIKEDGTVISEKQLTELSKGTLGDYVKGASHHAAHLSSNASHFKSKAMGHV